MKERERVIVTGLVVLMVLVWLPFAVHQSPRFAGSLLGGLFAVTGTALMLLPLAYVFVKRNRTLRTRVTRYITMRTLLTWHIYAGVLGPILVVIHTGHKFESPLGIALTSMVLLVVLSGFVGRYLMKHIRTELKEKKTTLKELQARYATLLKNPEFAASAADNVKPRWRTALATALLGSSAALSPTQTLARVATASADLEYAVRTHEAFKLWFGRWLRFHIVISFVLYALLALHVWAAIHFGLRWFE